MTAVLAAVSLNSPIVSLSKAVLAILWTAALWAGYVASFGFSSKNVVRDDLAAVRAVYDFVFHLVSAPANALRKNGCLRVRPRVCQEYKSARSTYILY